MILTNDSPESSAAAFYSCMQAKVGRLIEQSEKLCRERRAAGPKPAPKPKWSRTGRPVIDMRRHPWTEAERHRLIELRESGMWLRRIARALNRSEWSVKMELNRLVRKARASR